MNPVNIDQKESILPPESLNGRVNIIDIPNDVVFAMKEKIMVNNKTSEYRDPLTGILEESTLSKVFFCAENVQIIQNGLRAGVYKMSEDKYIIAPQNEDTLKIIMRSIYLQYAEHKPDDITEQIERLNKYVLEYAVPNVYNELIGYLKYCRDQSTLVTPIDLPVQSDREFRQLEMKPFV